MKKMLIKKLVMAIIIAIFVLLHSQAFATGGQANGTIDSLYNKPVNYYFELIRAMETESGTLGKASNINTTNYVDNSGNGIDCHLEKNTEYGTITLLAASLFGNPTSTDTESTGANNTGVFMMNTQHEYLASTLQDSEFSAKISSGYNKALLDADSRYVDEYKSLTKYSIPGDGIIETDGWGGLTNFVTAKIPLFVRGYGGIFGYSYSYGSAFANTGCRAVVVCGNGF